MRATEFIVEDKIGDMPEEQKGPMKSSKLVRDAGGYDRIYYLNRLGMAMAAANGRDTKKINGVDEASWVEKYNSVHAYTPEEGNMIDAAINTIPSESQTSVTRSQSTEPDYVHKVSPVTGFKGYKRK
jgi:hypothetical protein